jgi:hypothetical protein
MMSEESEVVSRMQSGRRLWTFLASLLALFVVVLDGLVVTTALPAIRADFAVVGLGVVAALLVPGLARREHEASAALAVHGTR